MLLYRVELLWQHASLQGRRLFAGIKTIVRLGFVLELICVNHIHLTVFIVEARVPLIFI